MLPLLVGELARAVIPFLHLQRDVRLAEVLAQRRAQAFGAFERADGIAQVRWRPGCAAGLVAFDVHIDIEALSGVARVGDPVEAGGPLDGLKQIRVGGAIGLAELEPSRIRYPDHMRAVIAGPGGGIWQPWRRRPSPVR